MKKIFSTAFGLLTGIVLYAQISLPPSGGNQKASVTQYMGLVSVTINYSSPDVHAPDGTDRRGKIWGGLVPYGMSNLQFGLSNDKNPSPWRAGANENTTIAFSHEVEIEGKPLAAGVYGLHMIPSENEWTVIFSKNTTAWGSYFYRPEEDVLRVTVQPFQSAYQEWLTYTFDDREENRCRVLLSWEELTIPIRISVPDPNAVYIQKFGEELQSFHGFRLENWIEAVNFCVERKTHLDQALEWADHAMNPQEFPGEKNFRTMQTKAGVLYAMKREAEADALMAEAIRMPDAGMQAVHAFGRQLLAQKKQDKALEIFKYNAEKFPKEFTVFVGLTRGYSGIGDYKTALKYARQALALAPDSANKANIEGMIGKLEAGRDCNL